MLIAHKIELDLDNKQRTYMAKKSYLRKLSYLLHLA